MENMSCNYCGRPLKQNGYVVNLPGNELMCGECFSKLGTCHLCTFIRDGCRFENDPSPLPKVVQETIRQGSVLMQRTVLNPERIEAFCTTCPCFDNIERHCGREEGLCLSYKEYVPVRESNENFSENLENFPGGNEKA